jgi:hypothetical protein
MREREEAEREEALRQLGHLHDSKESEANEL